MQLSKMRTIDPLKCVFLALREAMCISDLLGLAKTQQKPDLTIQYRPNPEPKFLT